MRGLPFRASYHLRPDRDLEASCVQRFSMPGRGLARLHYMCVTSITSASQATTLRFRGWPELIAWQLV